jgi:uncharacterized protein YbgA (DUF1722 family)/uncharacterized protein YbbK (DUF523 family)
MNTYSPFFEWIPFCPEADSGMGIPREAMRLEGDPHSPRLITRNSKVDKTEQLMSYTVPRVEQFAQDDICGIILKKGSPSCGLYGLRPLTEKGMPGEKTSGLFAAEVKRKYPLLPMEEEGRLNDPYLRETFVEKVFVYHRWKDMLNVYQSAERKAIGLLTEFHQAHKYLLMAHNPENLKKLGQIVAEGAHRNPQELFADYFELLMETLGDRATIKKHRNVLLHLMGYFKNDLSHDEKEELIEQIDLYASEMLPLIVPVTLLKHYVRKYKQSYLVGQLYLEPHPKELMIRNSV